MNNRKDSIYEIIVKYTRESILDNTFQFEHCNAFDIALELKIDRSNVSRLLNQMFHEYLLIKINGRPTTYLSREVIVNEFHYSKAPQIIDNKEQLREQLILNTPVGNTSSPDFKIVGSNMGESLKEIIDKVIPCILLSKGNPLMLVLIGEKGCGKKHFCEQLFQYGIKKKIFQKQTQYLSVLWREASKTNEYLLQQISPESTGLILIEIFEAVKEEKIYELKTEIFNLYRNHGCHPPVLIFLADKSAAIEQNFSTLTPCIVQFPSFAQRRTTEKIKLILTLFQEASDVNQTHIRSNREVFTQLLSAKYKYNIFQLKNEIHYAISNSIYFSKSSYATLLPHFLSNELRENQMENQNYIKEMTAFVESSIPEFVDFYPNTNCTVLELLAADNMKSILLPKEKKTFQAQAQEDVLRMDVTLAAHIREERLHYLLGYIFAQTRIRYDIPLLNHLYSVIDQMIHGTFTIDCIMEDKPFQFSNVTSRISGALIEKIETSYNVTLVTSYRNYLRFFLEFSLKALNTGNIIYIIVSYNDQLSQNYAYYMNYISDTRSYYMLPFPREAQANYPRFVRNTQKLLSKLDESREIIIVSDREPLNTLSTVMVATLNRPILSLYPIALPLLMKTFDIMQEDNSHVVPMIRKIIYSKKDTLSGYHDRIGSFPSEYINGVIRHNFESFFPETNTLLANRLLYNIMKDIFDYFNCDLTIGMVLEFLLHGNFMIMRSSQKQFINPAYIPGQVTEDSTIYQIVSKRLNQSRELIPLNIDEKEILVLCDLLNHYRETSFS
ncbi:MAG: hypothetical protein HFI26_02365 [Lachnospiraceae bacterium]|nr:hypothetical protein [Lachnospiraceae bacterium]